MTCNRDSGIVLFSYDLICVADGPHILNFPSVGAVDDQTRRLNPK